MIPKGDFEEWKVYVESGGVPLSEYQVEHSLGDGGKVLRYSTCFVECQVDTDFAIVVKVPKNTKENLSLRFHVDGKVVRCPVYRAPDEEVRRSTFFSEVGGQIQEINMRFGALALKETDPGSNSGLSAEEIGTIVVTLQRGKSGLVSISPRSLTTPVGVLDEKLKKVRSISMTLVTEQSCQGLIGHVMTGGESKPASRSTLLTDFTPDRKGVYDYRFMFRYRSTQLLKAAGIIENGTPAPTSETDNDDVEDQEEMRMQQEANRLQEVTKRLQQEARRVQEEAKRYEEEETQLLARLEETREKRKIKTEPGVSGGAAGGGRRPKKAKHTAEIIDLTSD
ncbi:hypothetical protein P7C73_g1928, partial [Tremellales sp. Uapishka_1]